MKFWTPLLTLVALATAQQENAINHPNGGLQVTADQPFTLTWANPSSGTVTIKLQQGAGVTGNTGITLDTGVEASALTATFTIPADEVNASQYNFEIVDDTNPDNVNFSDGFSIAGASCVGTCDGGSSSSTSSAAASSASASGSSSSSASSASASSSSSASSASASSASASASATSAAASSSSASATAAVTTSAPSSNGGSGSLQAQAGLIVAVAAAIAAF